MYVIKLCVCKRYVSVRKRYVPSSTYLRSTNGRWVHLYIIKHRISVHHRPHRQYTYIFFIQQQTYNLRASLNTYIFFYQWHCRFFLLLVLHCYHTTHSQSRWFLPLLHRIMKK